MKHKLTIAFVCTGNTFRSQIGEAYAKQLGAHLWTAYSAGLEKKSNDLHPMTLKVMKEVGISMDGHFPKTLNDIPSSVDILVTMGCGAKCPFVPTKHRVEWNLPELDATDESTYRAIRDAIKANVQALVTALNQHTLKVG